MGNREDHGHSGLVGNREDHGHSGLVGNREDHGHSGLVNNKEDHAQCNSGQQGRPCTVGQWATGETMDIVG